MLLLRKASVRVSTKKVEYIEQEEIDKFLSKAQDERYLMQKVTAIFDIFRTPHENLLKLDMNNIKRFLNFTSWVQTRHKNKFAMKFHYYCHIIFELS